MDAELAGLNPKLRIAFKSAHETYVTNPGQGLQQAGQIVEPLIQALAGKAATAGIVAVGLITAALADMIDGLYQANAFRNYRAALGSARDFVREYRNTASHPARSAKQAAEKIKGCKVGFLDAIATAKKLRAVFQALGYTITINAT